MNSDKSKQTEKKTVDRFLVEVLITIFVCIRNLHVLSVHTEFVLVSILPNFNGILICC